MKTLTLSLFQLNIGTVKDFAAEQVEAFVISGKEEDRTEMSIEFLDADNPCGQNLLRLTSRGSAIVAELFRLADNIPEACLPVEQIKDPGQAKYAPILFDFDYMKEPEDFENIINASDELIDLDADFQENYEDIIARFYQLFESIWKYQGELNKYVRDVEDGTYLEHSVDGILQDTDGAQLLAEALYLYGTMILLMEDLIPGTVRERILVANYRYYGEANLHNIEVCRVHFLDFQLVLHEIFPIEDDAGSHLNLTFSCAPLFPYFFNNVGSM